MGFMEVDMCHRVITTDRQGLPADYNTHTHAHKMRYYHLYSTSYPSSASFFYNHLKTYFELT